MKWCSLEWLYYRAIKLSISLGVITRVATAFSRGKEPKEDVPNKSKCCLLSCGRVAETSADTERSDSEKESVINRQSLYGYILHMVLRNRTTLG